MFILRTKKKKERAQEVSEKLPRLWLFEKYTSGFNRLILRLNDEITGKL